MRSKTPREFAQLQRASPAHRDKQKKLNREWQSRNRTAIGQLRHNLKLAGVIAFVLLFAAQAQGARHHGKPTPTPSATPSPPPSPTPSPTASPSPTPSPTPTPAPTPTASPTVTLAWDASPDTSVTAYHLWEGQSAGGENMLAGVVLAGMALTVTLTLASGNTYYFVVTAYNGADSLPSNEVSYTPP